MNLLSAIAHVWNDVEQAHRDGHLVNQSTLAFVLCESLRRELPVLQITYDGRLFPDSTARPNLYVWQDGANPVVHFISILWYGPSGDIDYRQHILSLNNSAALPAIPVLTRDPVSLDYIELDMDTSNEPELGIFIVDEAKVESRYWLSSSGQ